MQSLQRRLGFAGNDLAVRHYQAPYAQRFATQGRVLDLGCGPGVFLEVLRDSGRRGLGVDASPDDVADARSRGLDVVEADVLAFLESTTESFDGIFCAHVVEHLPPAAALRLITGARRVLRAGGILVLITPDVRDLEVMTERFWLDLTHVRPYPEKLLRAMCEAEGFRIVESGNDSRSARGNSAKARLLRWWSRFRLGKHGHRGDVYVAAARTE